jgi:hypothetical protein
MEDAIFKAKKPAELEAKIRDISIVAEGESAGLRGGAEPGV